MALYYYSYYLNNPHMCELVLPIHIFSQPHYKSDNNSFVIQPAIINLAQNIK